MFTLPKKAHFKLETSPGHKIMKINYIREYAYIGTLAIIFCIIVSIITYNPNDPSTFHMISSTDSKVSNYFGLIGASIADWSFQLFGLSAILFLIFFMFHLAYSFRQLKNKNIFLKLFGYPQLLLFYLGFATGIKTYSNFKDAEFFTGGIVGFKIFSFFTFVFGQKISLILLAVGMVASLTVVLGIKPISSIFWLLKLTRSQKLNSFTKEFLEDTNPVIADLSHFHIHKHNDVNSLKNIQKDQHVFLDLLKSLRSNESGSLHSIMLSNAYQQTYYKLPLICGLLPAQTPFIIDLTTLPNLFIETKKLEQKQEFLNTIMVSLLLKKTPSELKFILIDPQMCDLAAYNNIGHLQIPIVTSAHKSTPVLQWLQTEVEERYARFKKIKASSFIALQSSEEFPYLVVIVGELKELTQTIPYEFEHYLQKLIHKAYLVGIHFIFATNFEENKILPSTLNSFFSSKIKYLNNSLIYIDNFKSEYLSTQPIEISKEEVYTILHKIKNIYPFCE